MYIYICIYIARGEERDRKRGWVWPGRASGGGLVGKEFQFQTFRQ